LGQKVKRWRKVKGERKQVEIWKADVTPHTLRHTWATWFYAAHRDVRALMELGGWKSISQVQRYTHANKEHLRDKVEALADWGISGGRRAPASEKSNAAR
jgi:site-specific recombinase XerD